MEWFNRAYVAFNQCECFLWWGFGLYFVYRVCTRGERGSAFVPALFLIAGFFLFGLSDYFESNDTGAPPMWLWIWKILNGTFLFGLLIWRDYTRRGKAALVWWRFAAAGVILLLATYGMIAGKA